MAEHRNERWAALAGFVACASVGVLVALQHLDGETRLEGPPWAWWASYLVYLGAFVGGERATRDSSRLDPRSWLAVQVIAGMAGVGLGFDIGWMPVLFVVTTVTAGYLLPPRQTGVLVVLQSAWTGAVALMHGLGTADAVVAVLVYGMFQTFAAVMVYGAQREASARSRLAEAHADLTAATALLAESSRADERVRIARDLHDMIGHQLTALTLELEVASHRAALPAREHVDRAGRIARDLLAGVRTAVGQLRTDTAPLQAALQTLALDLTTPAIHVEVDDELEVEGDVALALVRCAQEIMTNSARHAGADNLWFEVGRDPDGTTILRARDDGRGSSELRLGNGLTGMCERLGALGGSVSFDHTDGFMVTARVPGS